MQGETFNPKVFVIPGTETTAPDCASLSEGIVGRGIDTISYLTFLAEAPIKVTVLVISPQYGLEDVTGRYSLRVTTNDDRIIRIIPGSYYEEELIPDDRRSSEGAPFDCYQFPATQGELVRFSLEMLGPTLTIYSDGSCKGSVLARSNDSDTYMGVQSLRHQMTQAGTYSVGVRSHIGGGSGEYKLRMWQN